ncbi:MAG: GNAT family N-acetyltransferase [Ferruginibacter sp.]
MVELIFASTQLQYQAATVLFSGYAEWLGIDLSFQNFSEELRQVKSVYAPPCGCVILAKYTQVYAGCIAVKKLSKQIAEVKRMYVLPDVQQKGIGKALLAKALDFAREVGYEKVQLDTLAHMHPAINLYKQTGFYEIPAYYYNPQPTALYFEKSLQ